MKIEIKKNKSYLNNQPYSKLGKNQDIGDHIINILFYNNRDGKHEIEVIINGVDETTSFKEQVIKKYKDIKNQELKNNFYKYCSIK